MISRQQHVGHLNIKNYSAELVPILLKYCLWHRIPESKTRNAVYFNNHDNKVANDCLKILAKLILKTENVSYMLKL